MAVLCNAAQARSVQLGRAVATLYLPSQPHPGPEHAGAAVVAFDPAVAGLWADTRTGEPFSLAVGMDGSLRSNGGEVVLAQSPTLYEMGAERLEFTSSDAFDRVSANGARRGYRRETPVTPTAEQLAAYAGVFTSDEAQARLTVQVRDGVLTLVNRGYAMPMSAVYADVFTSEQGLIRFSRDEDGRVEALHVNNGRVRDMPLRREE